MGVDNHTMKDFTNLVCLLSSILMCITVPTHQFYFCYNRGNFTADSTYAKNLNLTLSSLASEASRNGGFYEAPPLGREPDAVYALALCRGDYSSEICESCVNAAIQEVIRECPNQKEAISWGSQNLLCIVHYANRSFYGKLELQPSYVSYYGANYKTDLTQFNDTWQSLTQSIKKNASENGSSRLKFATGKADLTYVDTIYALMQCTPDLASDNCNHCLAQYVDSFHRNYHESVGNMKGPNCFIEWGFSPFYNETSTSIASSPNASTPNASSPDAPVAPDKDGIPFGTVVKIVVPTTVFIAVIITLTYILLGRRKAEGMRSKQEMRYADKEIKVVESLQFEFSTIRAATNNFSIDCKLGQGGFGAVYKGKLPDGQDIAVKRLSKNSGQGDLEFKNEVLIVARLQHRNLVRLLGFCLEGEERLLIYEFLPNSSLDKFLFDQIKRLLLDWEKRYKILRDIARGILYLHEDSRLRVIHRDLKVSNILLDEDMNPKISDFGMAKLFETDQTQDDTRRIAGTFGYMAPEYVRRGRFSVKSDVFSFGVLVLETISGQKNSRFHNEEEAEGLLSYAWRNWKEGTVLNIIDPTLTTSSSGEIMRCIHIGLLCVQENKASRPNMASVVLMLTSCSFPLPEPSEPAFLTHTTMEQNSVPSAVNEASITELDPR